MDPFIAGVVVAIICCALFNAYLYWTCKVDEDVYEHPLERIHFIVNRSRYHRDALAAYHEELCEHWAVHSHSHEGDELHRVVFDGADYDTVIAELIGWAEEQ